MNITTYIWSDTQHISHCSIEFSGFVYCIFTNIDTKEFSLTQQDIYEIMSDILYETEEYTETGIIDGVILKGNFHPHQILAVQKIKCKYIHEGGLVRWEKGLMVQ